MTRLLLFLAAICTTASSFQVVDNAPNGFTVSVDNVLLLQHTEESPIFFVGKGNLQVTEGSGNFFFEDKVYARLPLFSYKLSQDADSWTVVLTQGDVTATLKLSAGGDKDLELSVVSVSDGYTHYWLRVAAETDEETYGAGEQFSFLNLREKVEYKKNIFPIWINEQVHAAANRDCKSKQS
ncbi:alpha-glucosidase [Elysia marginata]|uniref:Alpha-glucosidase n=1 Tax=Elysia marginata TaxID=1093978 RepID=A0AAV4EIY0_9GAST|nr:alpha-glucosidase [Elysia marginata]